MKTSKLLRDLKRAGLSSVHRQLVKLLPVLTKPKEPKALPKSTQERTTDVEMDDVDMWRPREPLKTKIQPPRTYVQPLREKTMLGSLLRDLKKLGMTEESIALGRLFKNVKIRKTSTIHKEKLNTLVEKAFIFAMDYEADGGQIPDDVEPLLEDRKLSTKEKAKLVKWFMDTCPTDALTYS